MNAPSPTPVRMIAVDRIRVVNPRTRDREKHARIIDSIATVGLKKPITVISTGQAEDGSQSYDLVCGQGRLEAYLSMGQKEIPAVVRSMSSADGLLAGLVENVARRRLRALDQIKLIQWMMDRDNNHAQIAKKTGLGEEYIRNILNLLQSGEERLLNSVLRGRIPITIAIGISGASDEHAQAVLMEAYEKKELTQKTLRQFRRLVDLRRIKGRSYGPPGPRGPRLGSLASMVRAYRNESQRQKIMIRKAKICEARLLSISAAIRVLVADEDFTNLLRAEELQTMPKFIAERAKSVS